MWKWSQRHPRLSAVGGVAMLIAGGLATIQGIWNLFSNEPLFPYIATNVPIWPRVLLIIVFCGVAVFGIVLTIKVFHRTNRTAQQNKEVNKGETAIPSQREALESAKVAWGLWHTGQRMRAKKLIGAKSLQRILLLNPESKESIDEVARRVGGEFRKERKRITQEINDTIAEALANQKAPRLYAKHRESSLTIYDSTPIENADGILMPCSDNAWIYLEILVPNVGIDQWKDEIIYNKGKDKPRFGGYFQEYQDIWDKESIMAKDIKEDKSAEEKPTVIKDTGVKLNAKDTEKATGMKVTTPSELKNVRVDVTADNVKEATGLEVTAINKEFALSAETIVCSCGNILRSITTHGYKPTIICPKCGKEYKD